MTPITLQLHDDVASQAQKKAESLNITRHKLIVNLVKAAVADVKVLEQSEWPTTERLTICPECSQLGPHCGNMFSEIHTDERKQTRIRWLCRCSQCAPEVTA